MSIDRETIDMRSMRALREAFRSAPEPDLADLVGAHEGEFIGPAWLRAAGPVAIRLGRMPGWCGKRFAPAQDGAEHLVGVNLVRSGGRVERLGADDGCDRAVAAGRSPGADRRLPGGRTLPLAAGHRRAAPLRRWRAARDDIRDPGLAARRRALPAAPHRVALGAQRRGDPSSVGANGTVASMGARASMGVRAARPCVARAGRWTGCAAVVHASGLWPLPPVSCWPWQ